MGFSRLPRFTRASSVAALHITDRDRAIINFIRRHRFLRSSQIISLAGGSRQQILRRLKLLYHHGYLERPRAQLDYYHKRGSQEIVYAATNRGAAILSYKPDIVLSENWTERNRSVGRTFLEHALLVSDVMVALELACRASSNIRLIPAEVLARAAVEGSAGPAFRWKVNLPNRRKLGVVPDSVFALEFPNENGRSEQAFFFLEADRGTMPVMRRNFSQTSFYRKLVAYEATWAQSIHRKRFRFHRFRLLTVTTTQARLKSIIQACSKLERGHGLFLFADRKSLENLTDVSSPIWQSCDGERTSLLT